MRIGMKYGEVRHYLFDVEMLRRRLLRPHFIKMGLTVGQGQPRILYELRKSGRMTQKELSDACLIEVTTMSRTLDRLEKMGLIIRENNPECRRSWIIKLTKQGEAKLTRCPIYSIWQKIYSVRIYRRKSFLICVRHLKRLRKILIKP